VAASTETRDYIYDPGISKNLGRDAPISRAELEASVRKREIVYLIKVCFESLLFSTITDRGSG